MIFDSHPSLPYTTQLTARSASRVASCFFMSALAAEASWSERGEASCHEVNASINALRTTWVEQHRPGAVTTQWSCGGWETRFRSRWDWENQNRTRDFLSHLIHTCTQYRHSTCIRFNMHAHTLLDCSPIHFVCVALISVLQFCWWYWWQMDELWMKYAGWNISSEVSKQAVMYVESRSTNGRTASHSNLLKALASEWTKINQTWQQWFQHIWNWTAETQHYQNNRDLRIQSILPLNFFKKRSCLKMSIAGTWIL